MKNHFSTQNKLSYQWTGKFFISRIRDKEQSKMPGFLSAGLRLPHLAKSIFALLVSVCIYGNAHAATYIVSSTNDAGAGSLRQAITNANTNAGADVINFGITGSGPFTIALASLLPVITDPVTINGYSQAGSTVGVIGSRTIMIAINGNSIQGRDGLFRFTSAASGSSLSGLSIYNTGSSVEAVAMEPGCANIHIWGNYIGVLPNGTRPGAALVNRDDGVFIGDRSATSGTYTNITIGTNGDGTNDVNEGNVISNSADAIDGGDGIQIGCAGATYIMSNIRISGNYIGLAADG